MCALLKWVREEYSDKKIKDLDYLLERKNGDAIGEVSQKHPDWILASVKQETDLLIYQGRMFVINDWSNVSKEMKRNVRKFFDREPCVVCYETTKMMVSCFECQAKFCAPCYVKLAQSENGECGVCRRELCWFHAAQAAEGELIEREQKNQKEGYLKWLRFPIARHVDFERHTSENFKKLTGSEYCGKHFITWARLAEACERDNVTFQSI